LTRDRSDARRALLRRLIAAGEVESQEDAVRLLADRGHAVTQATVSRDLAAIGADKRVDRRGRLRYVLADAAVEHAETHGELTRMLRAFVVDIGHSGNIAVLHTSPGSAGPVAFALDRARPSGVLGTVAGDDTVLVVSRAPAGGEELAQRLETLLEGGGR